MRIAHCVTSPSCEIRVVTNYHKVCLVPLTAWIETDAEANAGSIAKKASNLGVSDSSLKLPVIKSIAFSTARSKDWDDVVTYSEGESMGRSWSVEGKRVGKWTLKTEGVVTVSPVHPYWAHRLY